MFLPEKLPIESDLMIAIKSYGSSAKALAFGTKYFGLQSRDLKIVFSRPFWLLRLGLPGWVHHSLCGSKKKDEGKKQISGKHTMKSVVRCLSDAAGEQIHKIAEMTLRHSNAFLPLQVCLFYDHRGFEL